MTSPSPTDLPDRPAARAQPVAGLGLSASLQRLPAALAATLSGLVLLLIALAPGLDASHAATAAQAFTVQAAPVSTDRDAAGLVTPGEVERIQEDVQADQSRGTASPEFRPASGTAVFRAAAGRVSAPLRLPPPERPPKVFG